MNTHSGDRNLCESRARVTLYGAITLWLALCFATTLPCKARAQSWQAVNVPFTNGSGTPLLLTDGTVIVQDVITSNWWKLTPNLAGSYVNGTWSQIASMPVINGVPYAPLYYGSAVLADGRVVVVGGEYNNGVLDWYNGAAIYDPVANTWTALNGPGWPQIGDASTCILPNGQFLLQDPFNTDAGILNPGTLTWSTTTPPPFGDNGKADINDEEGWTLLPDGTILTVDVTDIPNSELFDPVYGDWYSAGLTPEPLADFVTGQMGPQVLRPDGTTVCFGATGFNAIYNWYGSPTQSPAPGTWAPIQPFPFVIPGPGFGPVRLVCTDAPACLLPSGNVLVCCGPGAFSAPLYFFECDLATNRLIPEPTTVNNSGAVPPYATSMLMLPTGQVLLSDFSQEVEFYTPTGIPNPAWQPAITSAPATVSPGQTYRIAGTQFNGLSQCSAYGDGVQNATNYPLIRVTMQATGDVIYYRTHNHSSMGVATGSTPVSTYFTVPLTAELGAAQLVVVTNGIPSLPISVTVTPPPTATAQTVDVAHNTPKTITLTGTDPSTVPLIYAIVTQPLNGTLSDFDPNTGVVIYTPNFNFQGADSFTFTVSDGTITSQPGTLSLVVAAGVPVAYAQSDLVGHDAGKQLLLTGSDPNDNPVLPLTFVIAKQPTNGTLSYLNPTSGAITYQPNANYQGKDSFTFTVTNGQFSSPPATVSLTVAAATPYATPQTLAVALNTAKSITLTGTDTDVPPLPLTFGLLSSPANGTLSGFNAATGAVTYTPNKGYKGTDSFLFYVSNGNQSAPATVTLVVAPATPTANPQTVDVIHNTTTAITLTGTDPDNPPLALTFAIVASPTHGTLTGLNTKTGAVTYKPVATYQGTDSFTFTVNNGVNTSLPAKVTLEVAAGTPTATPQTVAIAHNTAKTITLAGTDPDVPALPLTYTIVTEPAHGTLSGFNPFSPLVTYTPAANYHGADSFTFTVSNGTNTSTPATVSLTVAVGVPVANAQSVAVTFNTRKAITLTGSDADTPTLPLTFAIGTSPTHGTLSGLNAATGAVTYTPDTGYLGTDSFTFTVSNGTNRSTAARVSITVSEGG